MRKIRVICFIISFLSLIAIDQFSKYLVRHFGGFYICNSGISFGFQIPEFLFWLLWIIIISILIYFISKNRFLLFTFYFLLILAGALGNIIDRLYFGCIIDFIDWKFWPVFNLADVYISIGAILLLFSLLKQKSPKN